MKHFLNFFLKVEVLTDESDGGRHAESTSSL
jgi:hypothetical protein